jgi:hypothetical protein
LGQLGLVLIVVDGQVGVGEVWRACRAVMTVPVNWGAVAAALMARRAAGPEMPTLPSKASCMGK